MKDYYSDAEFLKTFPQHCSEKRLFRTISQKEPQENNYDGVNDWYIPAFFAFIEI